MLQIIGFALAGAIGGAAAFAAINALQRKLITPDSSAKRRQIVPLLIGTPAFVVGFLAIVGLWQLAFGDRLDNAPVTASAPGFPGLNSGNASKAEAAIIEEINKFRFVQVLQKYRPETRDRLAAIVHESVEKRDASLAQIQTTKMMQEYFPQYVPRSSDDAIVAFGSAIVDLFDYFEHNSVETCKSLATGGNLTAGLSVERMKPTLDAMADVIESAASKPQDPPNAAQAQVLISSVLEKLYAGSDPDRLPMTALASPATAPAKQLCHTMRIFYVTVLKLPKADASIVMRQLISSTQ